MSGLEVASLSVHYGEVEAVRHVDLSVEPGTTHGLVGESGSGKSTLALAVLRALPSAGRVASGQVHLGGDDVLALEGAPLQRFHRDRVKFVPQNPLPSMNPSWRIGRQLREAANPDQPRSADVERIDEMLASVGLPDPARIRAAYPFELSGGQQQRVMIAMALLGKPDLLVLDEPTTNLDVTTEAAILELVRERVRDTSTAVLYVSHSLGVVAQLCDEVTVLYAGEAVERAPVRALYASPAHPYTIGLLGSVPRLAQGGERPPLRPIPGRIPSPNARPSGCIFAPRCPAVEEACRQARPDLASVSPGHDAACRRWQEIRDGTAQALPEAPVAPDPGEVPEGAVLVASNVDKRFPLRRSWIDRLRGRPRRAVRALNDVDLTVRRGRTLGLVGESGSGKSTFARGMAGLEPISDGDVTLLGAPLPARLEDRGDDLVRALQMVFQSSDEALNPFRSVGATLRRPFVRLGGRGRAEADDDVAKLLMSVQLDPSYATRRPDALSGGEKQRVAVARAFAADPELILFDESVSGLDVSVQAAVLNLLMRLRMEKGASYLFISHDLSVVAHLADDVAVLYLGEVMESGDAEDVLAPPYHPYTEALLAAVPRVDPDHEPDRPPLEGDVPSPLAAPAGCPFATRCPRVLGDVCFDTPPPVHELGDAGHRIRCHIDPQELLDDQIDLVERSDP